MKIKRIAYDQKEGSCKFHFRGCRAFPSKKQNLSGEGGLRCERITNALFPPSPPALNVAPANNPARGQSTNHDLERRSA